MMPMKRFRTVKVVMMMKIKMSRSPDFVGVDEDED